MAGRYVARVTFRDDAGVDQASAELIFGTDNLPPVAHARVRGVPDGSSPVTLDGSASFDVDGDALSYLWRIENTPDGSRATLRGQGPLISVTLDLEGDYTVSLQVQDAQGQMSAPALVTLGFRPNSGTTDVYRLSYDAVSQADPAMADSFDLGERLTAAGGHDRIDGFVLDDGAGALADTLLVSLDGTVVEASTAETVLALIDVLELDTDPLTNARMSLNPEGRDLTLIFGDQGGSVTLSGVIGDLLTRADLETRGVDYYEGVGGRLVAPVASGRFDTLAATPGVAVPVEPYASVDVDGDVLVAQTGVLVAPAGASAEAVTDLDGLTAITVDRAGDYLVALNVDDGGFVDQDHVLVVAGGGPIRPVARIAPVTGSAVGERLVVDGSQSYDLNGDLLRHDWALLSAPQGSLAVLETERTGFVGLTPDQPGLYVVQLIVSDDRQAGVPQTVLIRVAPPLPVAEAGRDRLVGDLGQVTLDGTLSSGGNLRYAWSSLGLMGDGSSAEITAADTAQPQISLAIREGRFRDVIRLSPVYHFKRPDTGGFCQFDTRLPGDVGDDPSEPVQITLHSRGRQAGLQGDLLVWEIENKALTTQEVRLTDSDGVTHGTWVLPGRVSLHVTTPEIAKRAEMRAVVNGVTRASDGVKSNPFNRNNPVCTGPGGGVVQLIVADKVGQSLPDTVFLGNANLRPELAGGARFELVSGETVTLDAALYGYDGNGDALGFGWSLIARPEGSQAALDAAIVAQQGLVFAPDRVGVYLLQITATDGLFDAVPAVIEVEVINSAPVAVAQAPAEVFVGEVATLDGSGSFDPDGDALDYRWSLLSAPSESAAALSDPFGALAQFSPDRRGTYVFALEVSDYEFTTTSETVSITAPNRPPVAIFQGPEEVDVDKEVVLTAAGSSDPDNDPLAFSYEITAQPAGASGFIADLGDGEVGFVADLPGDYEITVTVDDGLLTTSASVTVTARPRNAPPVLGAIEPLYTVELGLELALDLVGSDPDGDAISFYATPLPLAQGITVDAASGQVRFRPEAGQLGSYSFTVGVSDGTLTDSAVLNIEVVAASFGDTAVTGRVLDAKTLAPLAGMPVRLRDAALMATTAADGSFSFGSLTAGGDQVIVEPSANGGPGGYLGSLRTITVTENQNRDLDPDFLLVPLTDGCASVVANQDTVISSQASGLTVSIAANSIRTSTGAAYTGDVCLGSLPDLFDHAGFDEDTQACRIFALDAPGAVFSQGVQITGPNLDNLPEPARLDLWRVSSLNGLFRRVADAGVDAGGATVSGQLSRFEQGALFTFLPQSPLTRAGAGEASGMQMLTAFKGDNTTSYTLPGYTAFGETQAVTFAYHSQAANPTIIVAGDVTIADDASLPVTLDTRIEAGGLSILDTRSWTPRQGLDGSTPALLGEEVVLSQSMPVDGSGLDSGRYAYRFVSRAKYDCSTVGGSHNSEFYVQNQAQSPYGNGWSIGGLQKLVEGPDGKVSIIDDAGVTTFDPEPTLTEFVDEPLVFPSIGTTGIFGTDIDGDGDLDVVYGENGKGALTTVLNYGAGDLRLEDTVAFATPNAVPDTGNYPPNLAGTAIGEMNNDGAIDVAYVLQDQRGYGYLANDGFGNFASEFQQLNTGRRGLDVVVDDIDGDGYEDIIYGAASGFFFIINDEIWVSYGGENGRELRRISYRGFSGEVPLQVQTGDIDGDGDIDVAYRTREGVDFVFNNGNRSYTLRTLRAGIGGARFLGNFMRLQDFNGDGKLDLIYSSSSQLQYIENTTGQAFAAPVILSRPPNAGGVLPVNIADANGDGTNDLVVTSGAEIFVYISNGDGTFQPFESGLVDYGFGEIDLQDINGDGSLDLLSTQRFTATVHFSKPSASGRFVSGDGEFSQLTRLPDGTWERRMKDGTVIVYDETGLQTAEIDPQGNAKTYAYDADGRLQTITDQVGGQTSFVYDADGRVASVTYPDGRVTAFEYDDIGNLNQVTEPTGSTVSFAYDETGRLISATNQNGNSTAYEYDAAGNLFEATMPDGSTISNQVAASLGLIDGFGGPATNPLIYVAPEDRITTVTDRKGEVTIVEVNQFGSVIRISDPTGREVRFIRDEENLVRRVERPSEAIPGGVRVDLLEFDQLGNVTSVTEAAGSPTERTMSFVYEPEFNNVVSMTDPDGFTRSFAYDAFGEVTQITDAEGGVQAFTYTAEGKHASRTDENGNTTSFAYNALLNLESVTYADGSTSQIAYDAAGNMTTIAEATGTAAERQTQRAYDALNRVVSTEVTGADGVQIDGLTQYTYLPAGNLETVTDETGLVTTMGYDVMERVTSIDDPTDGLIRREYNLAGEVVQQFDGVGAVHDYAYDSVGRLIEINDAEGFIKTLTYDSSDNIASVTDGVGNVTTYGYDALDRLETRANPLGGVVTLGYDARGNVISLTREDGQTETRSYDGLGRHTQTVTADNTLRFAYDPRGNMIEAADNDSRITFAYDLRDRMISATTDGAVGPQPQVTLSYVYDALDRRISMTDSLGGTTSYLWDDEDRLTELTAPWATVMRFGYDGDGRRTSLTSSSGRASSYVYANGLLSELDHVQSGAVLLDEDYLYGADGQLGAIFDNRDPALSRYITYDSLNRLLQVEQGVPPADGGTPIPVEDYSYDEEGNRLTSHLSALYQSNAYNQLTEDSNFTYGYDAKGNRISRTSKVTGETETYSYDAQNQLIEYASPSVSASYAYDAMGRRIAKSVTGEAAEAYVYDTMDLSDPTMSNRALGFADGVLAERWLFGPEIDEPLAYERYSGASDAPGSGEEIVLYADRRGSIISAVATASATELSRYDYDGFGRRTATGALDQPYGFTGRVFDDESGLIYFRARYYDPATGQFLQVDPIEFLSGDFDLYGYVSQDPFNYVDPTGLSKGSIKKPGVAGPSTTEFNLLGAAAREMREEAIAAIAEGAFSLLLEAMGQARLTLANGNYSPVRPEVHHCTPKSVGGSNSPANLAKMRRIRHMYVHKLMRVYMRPFRTKRARNSFVGMDLRQGWSKAEIDTIAKQFYRDIDAILGVGTGC